MPTPQPLLDVRPRLLFSFRSAILCDERCERDDDPRLVMGTAGEPDLVEVAPGGIALVSAANDFYPAVRVRVFDEEPAAEDGWDASQQAEFTAPSGALDLTTVDPGGGVRIELPRTGRVQVRVYCRGRDAAASQHGTDPLGFMYTEGVEEWLLDLWVRE